MWTFAQFSILTRMLQRTWVWLTTARDDRGASFVECAFLLALIVLFCLVAVTLLGEDTRAGVTDSASSIASMGS